MALRLALSAGGDSSCLLVGAYYATSVALNGNYHNYINRATRTHAVRIFSGRILDCQFDTPRRRGMAAAFLRPIVMRCFGEVDIPLGFRDIARIVRNSN